MKADEVAFLNLMQSKCRCPFVPNGMEGLTPRELLKESGLPAKRMWYILQKWAGRDWYDYGVSLDLGWLTLEGLNARPV